MTGSAVREEGGGRRREEEARRREEEEVSISTALPKEKWMGISFVFHSKATVQELMSHIVCFSGAYSEKANSANTHQMLHNTTV